MRKTEKLTSLVTQKQKSILFRHLTTWILLFLDPEALIFKKPCKNGVNDFEEAGLAIPIFAGEAGLRPASSKFENMIFFQKMYFKTFSFKNIVFKVFLTFFRIFKLLLPT